MSEPGQGVGPTPPDPWPVRISLDGVVLGAGIAFHERLVLTCAHLVPAAAVPDVVEPVAREPYRPLAADTGQRWPLTVDTALGRDFVASPARVRPDGWQPRQPGPHGLHHDGGDVAVLELAEPLTGVLLGGMVRRNLVDQLVRVHGFHDRGGLWSHAKVFGWSGELVQLEPADDQTTRVSDGYSGGAVLDATTKDVLGMVVLAHRDAEPGHGGAPALMMPIDTATAYLPGLEGHVVGLPRTSAELVADGPASDAQLRTTALITEVLARDGGQLLVVVDPDDLARRAVLSLLASGTDPVSRGRVLGRQAGPGSDPSVVPVPPVASVDVAFDVTDRSVAEVTGRIGERLGSDRRRPGPTVVLDSVDRAADPAGLLDALISLVRNDSDGGRVVAGCRELADGNGLLARADGLVTVIRPVADEPAPAGTVPQRLAWLEAGVTELRDLEHEVAPLSRRFTGTPTAVAQQLVQRVTLLFLVCRDGRDNPNLPILEHTVAQALRQARDALGRPERWRRLRGELEAHHRMALAHGLAEHPEQLRRHHRAAGALDATPCDLTECERRVAEYRRWLWGRLDGDGA